MSDQPVAYKRTVTRRESFRVDFDANDTRAALSNALDEDIPPTAAFRMHDDGGCTFCWDVDVDVDGPAIERPAPGVLVVLDETPVEQRIDEALIPRTVPLPVEDESDQDLTPLAELVIGRPDPSNPYEKNLARLGVDLGPSDKIVQEPVFSSKPAQCGGTFTEGVARVFRCHLDFGHAGRCGPAEGCEPEDPPKGRRRSW